MIKSLITDLALVIGGACVVYGVGNYQLFPNIGEANAAGVVLVAVGIVAMGLMGLFGKAYGFFKA
jgi:hypothetical protein